MGEGTPGRAGAVVPARRWTVALAMAAMLLPVSACDGGPLDQVDDASADRATDGSGQVSDPGAGQPVSFEVPEPGPFQPPLERSDVLISASDTLPDKVVKRIGKIKGVRAVTPFSMASMSINGRTVTVGAVDPAQFRRFTPVTSAKAQFVWDRVAGGEVAMDPSVPKKLIGKGDMVKLGTRKKAPEVHVGAFAPLAQRREGLDTAPVAGIVVNQKRGEQIGLPDRNALLVSTTVTPSAIKRKLKGALPPKTTLQNLALELGGANQTAVLAGQSVSQAIGKFTYTNGPDGTINPDKKWVNGYIRTEDVPILGQVTCNKAFLIQFRAALNEVVARGLASKIHADEYAGCYYPRYIGRDSSNGLSLHSWGIAVDLNVPGNLRGTRGEIDREVVKIMKKWGMAWGGDWNYTDPMHFELERIVRPG